MTFKTRRIFKSEITSQNVVRELLQFIFLGELISAKEGTWLVSPWISDVFLLDNRGGAYDAVNPEWGHREIRLRDLALQLMTTGSPFYVVTRPLEHNEIFVENIRWACEEAGVSDQLHIVLRETLHTKGVLTTTALLTGSMNLTYYGLELNDEVVEFDIDPASVSTARLNFQSYLEG